MYLKDTSYYPKVVEAMFKYMEGNKEEAKEILHQVPSAKDLFDSLLKQLEGKPVHKTLKKLDKNPADVTELERLKALFSLGTHATIAIEKGETEYRALLPLICDTIYAIVAK